MKKFKYKLEAVLEHKKLTLNRVQKKQSDLLREKALIDEELNLIAQTKSELSEKSKFKNINDLKIHDNKLSGYRRRERELIEKKSLTEQEIIKSSNALKKAHIAKRSIEIDKERKQNTYTEALNKKIESSLSDLVIQNFVRQ